MKLLEATIFGFTAWRLCLSGALVALYFVLRYRWARAAALEGDTSTDVPTLSMSASAPKPGKLSVARARRAAKLTDTQRIDHLHRSVTLDAGQESDLRELSFGRLPRLRVKFVGIEHVSGKELARIKIDLGGATLDGGSAVEPVAENEFLMPRGVYGDATSVVQHTCDRDDGVSHLELRVSQIDIDNGSVAVDVMHVRGSRRAA